VAQAAVPVRSGDDPDSLAARVIVQEHRLYPAALALVAGGRARLEGERVMIDDDRGTADAALLSL
jgi:phosphoribosylglycinamide formyltransferase-1